MRACGNREYFRMHSLVNAMERKKVVLQFINSISDRTHALIQWCNYTNGNKINSTSGNTAAKTLLCARNFISFYSPLHFHLVGMARFRQYVWRRSRTSKKKKHTHKVALIRVNWIGGWCNDKFEPTDAWKLNSILCAKGEYGVHIFQKFHTAYRNDIRYSKIQVDSDHNILQKLELHAHRRMRCGCFGCGRKWVSFLGYQRAPSIPMRLNQTLKIHSR